jgi:hypothetical protein
MSKCLQRDSELSPGKAKVLFENFVKEEKMFTEGTFAEAFTNFLRDTKNIWTGMDMTSSSISVEECTEILQTEMLPNIAVSFLFWLCKNKYL